MSKHEEIEARLTAPGAPFEISLEPVLGEVMPVFKERLPSLRQVLADSAAHGDKDYMVCDDRRISFAEHVRLVASAAQGLSDRFGVAKGDRVAILAANCPEWIIAWWASVSLGAIPVGLNGWWSGEEIRYGVGDSDPKVLIGDRKRLARIETDLGVPVVEIESEFDDLCRYAPDAELSRTPIDEDDPATILYTSGTTGRPKGAINSHRAIIALVRLQVFHGIRSAMLDAGGAQPAMTASNCMLINTPLFHVSGLYAGAVSLLAAGVKTVWTLGRFDPVRCMEIIQSEQVTNWGPMGTMIYRVVNHPDVGKYDLSSLRNVGSGGAPISPDLLRRMREVFPSVGTRMGMGYGLTESAALATINFGEDLVRHPDSVGRPLPTIGIEIRDADGKAVPDGQEGEVHLRSALNMLGYWRNPAATAEVLLPGRWLRTGDIGRLEDGMLYLNARKRDLILRGAENIHPVEIEHCLEAHPGVREAAAVGVPSQEFGQEVKAIVVPEGDARLDPVELSAWVGERLAYYKVPAHWEIRREPLPRNATGKVMKHVLLGEAENPFVEE